MPEQTEKPDTAAARRARKIARRDAFKITGADNAVHHGKRVQLKGFIEGDRNRVEIAGVGETFSLRLEIRGNDNLVRIGANAAIRGLTVFVGSHIPAHQTELQIGRNFSISRGGVFYLLNSGNHLSFGDDCLLSYNTIVRCGEVPHLIFDRNSGAYLDVTEPVIIGNHVWIGEDVLITKRAGLADDTIVAARAVVTKRFEESHVAVGGNPARVLRRDLEWVRNPSLLIPGSAQYESFHAQQARFEAPASPVLSADLPSGGGADR